MSEGAKWALAVLMATVLALMFHFAALLLMALFDFDYFGASVIVICVTLLFWAVVWTCYMAISTRW